ncbi:helix-turn-helix domain-containing protein [Brachybacterium muris]|uniref:helix-turn-helix domain-containing protein n=1 Tax=Brachybacterium muris TaxID=219301 RepID=UPI00223B7FA8|nr:helix-turn-helix domain-containing protein [Brachybacterium muris]MCT1653667.1 helix-turn-helix domain-containing protein [Brachybacterium muris]
MNLDPNTDPFLTIEEAADWIQVSTKTIRRWIEDGRILAHQLAPGTIRVKASTIENLARQTSTTNHNNA